MIYNLIIKNESIRKLTKIQRIFLKKVNIHLRYPLLE